MTGDVACALIDTDLGKSPGQGASARQACWHQQCPVQKDRSHQACVALQDFMKAAQCAMYEFTDLGWWELDATGANPGPRQEGFVWHTDPGCILLPQDTRICFIRCDTADCVQKQASACTSLPSSLIGCVEA